MGLSVHDVDVGVCGSSASGSGWGGFRLLLRGLDCREGNTCSGTVLSWVSDVLDSKPGEARLLKTAAGV